MSDHNNISVERELHDLSTHKDWNVIIEEDESQEEFSTENEDVDNVDTEPVLIKVKSYDLPKAVTADLYNSRYNIIQQLCNLITDI